MKRHFLVGSILLATAIALAAATSYSIVINGQVADDKAIVVNGKTYVPLSVLKPLGVTSSLKGTTLTLAGQTAQGGSDQRASLEGCLGETLFNGIWRIKTSKLEAIKKDESTPGWGLTLELRNGAKSTLTMTDTGIDGTGQGIQMTLPNGNTLPVDPYDVQKLTFASLPQGGVFTHQLKFYFPSGTSDDQVQKPDKFLLEIKPSQIGQSLQQAGVKYSVPNPSLRVKLDCQK